MKPSIWNLQASGLAAALLALVASGCDTTVSSAGKAASAGTTNSAAQLDENISITKPADAAQIATGTYDIQGKCEVGYSDITILMSKTGAADSLEILDTVACAADGTFSYSYADPDSNGPRMVRAMQNNLDGAMYSGEDRSYVVNVAVQVLDPGTPPPVTTPTESPNLVLRSVGPSPAVVANNAAISMGNFAANAVASMDIDFENPGTLAISVSATSNNANVSYKALPSSLNPGAKVRVTFGLHTNAAGTFTTQFVFHALNANGKKDTTLTLGGTVKAGATPPPVTTPPVTTPPVTTPPVVTGPTNPVSGGARPHGINWNFSSELTDMDYDTTVKTLANDLGIQAARLYLGFNFAEGKNWVVTNKAHFASLLAMAKRFKDQGIHVTLVISPPEGVTAGTAGLPPQLTDYEASKKGGTVNSNVCESLTSLYNFSSSGTTAAGLIDMWELGNEVNMANYWQRTSKSGSRVVDYVNSYLKPGADCLHTISKGKAVVSTAGFTGAPESAVKEVTGQGGFAYVDFLAIHLYKDTLSEYKNAFPAVRAALPADKAKIPIAVTEWSGYNTQTKKFVGAANVLTTTQMNDWADFNDQIWALVKANATIAHYFTVQYNPDAAHGKCSAMAFGPADAAGERPKDKNGNRIIYKNSPFYESIKSWGN